MVMWEDVERCGSCQYIKGSFDRCWGNKNSEYYIFSRTSPILFQLLSPSASFYQKI